MDVGRPRIIRDKDEMRKWSRVARAQGKTVGLVPTMGFLHIGHLSLIHQAHHHAELIVVSIYVNPGICMTMGFTRKLVFPMEKKMELFLVWPENRRGGSAHESWVRVEKLEKGLCGKSRPLFFRGVATVVCKLLNIVELDVAFFGKTDYQQWRIIQRMALSINKSLFKAKSTAKQGHISCKELQYLVIQSIHEAGGRVDCRPREPGTSGGDQSTHFFLRCCLVREGKAYRQRKD